MSIRFDFFHQRSFVDENWTIDISKKHTKVIKDYLAIDNIPSEGINNIVFNAAKILGYCPNPVSKVECKRTGLVIGKVQSGKTSCFITTIALAFDNEYNMVVVLGGTKKNLVKQNKERIVEYFKDDDTVIVLDTEDNESQICEKALKKLVSNDRKVIIVSLKSTNKINRLNNNVFKQSYFSDKPVIIIDDEGDEYTLNALVKKSKMTPTYKAVNNLLNTLYIRAFISVTATPQANLIISTLDILSPDFGVLVYPGKGYCGLDTFHIEESKYCVEIPDSESSLFDEGIAPSYYTALSTYFVASAIYSLRENNTKKFSMLVHPSHKVNDLKIVHEKTKSILDSWSNLAEDPKDIGFKDLEYRLEEAYNNYKLQGVETGEFEEVLVEACRIIRFCEPHLITGTLQLADNDKAYSNNIYIGGQMVQRGLTIKGLAITYIIRNAKGKSNIDTVQQRARWFGYKNSILDLCRIYATEPIISNFTDIRIHEEELWEMIEINNLDGKKFKQMKRLFLLGDKLRMTRTSVGTTKSYSLKNWNIEKKFQKNEINRKHNIDLLNQIYQKYKSLTIKDETGENSYHEVIRDLDFNQVIENDLNNFMFPEDSESSIQFIKQIAKFLKKYDFNEKCDIVWMRHRKSSAHDIENDGRIHNYMVGRRPSNLPLNECSYLGDMNYRREGLITIQIHYIANKADVSQISPTLAIYVPYSIYNKIKRFEVPE